MTRAPVRAIKKQISRFKVKKDKSNKPDYHEPVPQKEHNKFHQVFKYVFCSDTIFELNLNPRETMPEARILPSPESLINRELAWLEFNSRVLEEAQTVSIPLLERVKFLAIFSSNLDEFFMIRVANLHDADTAGVTDRTSDGMTSEEQLEAISLRNHELVSAQYACLNEDVFPALYENGIGIVSFDSLNEEQATALRKLYRSEIYPVLTPMTVDPSHPFPYLRNHSLNLFVTFEGSVDPESDVDFAIVEVPHMLSRLIKIKGEKRQHFYVLLEEVIATYIDTLFEGLTVTGCWAFRITRDSDLSLEDRGLSDLLQDIERELRAQNFRRVVRLEVSEKMPSNVVEKVQDWFEVESSETYHISGMLDLTCLMGLLGIDKPRLKDPPFNPRLSPRLSAGDAIFKIIREGDLLLHHPYESFSTVMEFIRSAADDPRVLAIKITLYRTSGDAFLIQALKDAAEKGKQVTVLVELKARFDERNNIVWARELEQAGVHVVYGFVGLKTHCKAILVVRREETKTIRRYVHLATGNYNSSTAKLYTDIGLLTADPKMGEDISTLFNVLTGYTSQTIQDMVKGRRTPPRFRKVTVAPFGIVERFLELIQQEIDFHTEENPGQIYVKINSLSNPSMIEALYRASNAGVQIDLCVRGLCCLRPNVEGLSENIRVFSILDRFLEHPRVYYFHHGGEELVFLSSADWMSRNLFRRIELLFPIENPALKRRLIDEILAITFQDNVKTRKMLPNGKYERIIPGKNEPLLRSQTHFIRLARLAGIKSLPYEQAIKTPNERVKSRKSKKKKKSKSRRKSKQK